VSNDVAQIETEIEQTRAALADSIDQLLHRTSPKTILSREVEQVKATFVDPVTGEPRTPNILAAAGAVVGVVVAFVVLRKLSR